MRRTGIVLCVWALVCGACGGKTGAEFGRAEADSIKKMTQDFVMAYNTKDASKMATFFSGSAVLMPPNSSTLRGQESIKGYYDTRFADGATDLVLEPRDVTGSGTLAYASGAYRLRLVPQGGAERRDRGKYLWILRNTAGRWRSEYQMWSSDLPAAGAASTAGF